MTVDTRSVNLIVSVGTGSDAFFLSGDLEASVSLGTEQDNGAATLKVTSIAGLDERMPVQIYAGFTDEPPIAFNGEICGITWGYDGTYEVRCRDIMARLRDPWGGEERVYENQQDSAVIQNLIEASGVDSSLTSIEASYPYWYLGVIEPVVLRPGQNALDLIRQIDEIAFCRTFTRSNGAIYRRMVLLGDTEGTFSEGVNIITGSRTRDVTGIINKVIVRGLEYEGTPNETIYGEPNSYAPYPLLYYTKTIESNLVETPSRGLEVAQNIVYSLNARPNEVSLTVPGDATIQPGTTILVNSARLGLSNANLYTTAINHRIGKTFTSEIRAMSLATSGL